MAANYIGPGNTVSFTAGAAYSAGDPVLEGSVVGISQGTYTTGDVGEMGVTGIYEVTGTTGGLAAAEGVALYYIVAGDAFDIEANAGTGDCFAGWKTVPRGVTAASGNLFIRLSGGAVATEAS